MNISNNLRNKSSYNYDFKSAQNSLTSFMQPKFEQIGEKVSFTKSAGISNLNELQNLANKTSKINSGFYTEKNIVSDTARDISDDNNNEQFNIHVSGIINGNSELSLSLLFPKEFLELDIYSAKYDVTDEGFEYRFFDKDGKEFSQSPYKVSFDELKSLGVPDEAIGLLADKNNISSNMLNYTTSVSFYNKDKNKDDDDKDMYLGGAQLPKTLKTMMANNGIKDIVVQLQLN